MPWCSAVQCSGCIEGGHARVGVVKVPKAGRPQHDAGLGLLLLLPPHVCVISNGLHRAWRSATHGVVDATWGEHTLDWTNKCFSFD
jgi:hypothetical protein